MLIFNQEIIFFFIYFLVEDNMDKMYGEKVIAIVSSIVYIAFWFSYASKADALKA